MQTSLPQLRFEGDCSLHTNYHTYVICNTHKYKQIQYIFQLRNCSLSTMENPPEKNHAQL